MSSTHAFTRSKNWERSVGPKHRLLGGVCHALHTGSHLPFPFIRLVLFAGLILATLPTIVIYVILWKALPNGAAPAAQILDTQLADPTSPPS